MNRKRTRTNLRHTSHGMLFRRAVEDRLLIRDGGSRRNPRIIGSIDHAGGRAEVMITQHSNPLVSSPWVNCRAPWIRRSVDWHYMNFGRKDPRTQFCWVLDLEWREHFRKRIDAGEPAAILCEDAAHWMVEAMRLVLSRHWHGWELGIEEWPPEWEDYSHGDAGVNEYLEGRCRAA